MTNTLAIALFLLIVAVFAVDQVWLGGTLSLQAARVMAGFIEYLSFWR